MKRILGVIDMQNDFIDGALGTKEAVAIVPKVISKIEEYQQNNDFIYFTKDTHQKDYLRTQEGKNLPVEHCIIGTNGWELHPKISIMAKRLQERGAENIFEKGVFGSERLAETIRSSVEDASELTIELVGLCTDICILANAMVLKTYMPEAIIKVDAACCAGVTPESHTNALNAMKMCQVSIVNG